jgi:hypothetical protein
VDRSLAIRLAENEPQESDDGDIDIDTEPAEPVPEALRGI